MDSADLLTGARQGDELLLKAGGSWTAERAADLEQQLARWLEEAGSVQMVRIELTNVAAFDTFGAWLLERLRREFVQRGPEVDMEGLSTHNQQLFAEVSQTGKTPSTDGGAASTTLATRLHDSLESFGRAISSTGQDLRDGLQLLGRVVTAFGRIAREPRRFRLTSTVHQLDRAGWKAVPIVVLITFLIGAIIAQQGFFHFRKFGADAYVVDMVGILVLRELGVLLVAIMLAGRSGSAYTAELGSMKMREEIDALKTMGFDPIEILILPRVLVLTIAVPLLTFLGSMAALYGGGLVAWTYGGMDPDICISRLKEAISLTHFKVGMIKAPFMGAMIGLIACLEGLRVKGSAQSLGHHTTQSVVKSIFLVIVLDGLFAIYFASVGM